MPNEVEILRFDSLGFIRSDLNLDTFTFGERYLDEACYLMAEELSKWRCVSKLVSPKDAVMAARTFHAVTGLYLSTITEAGLIYPALHTSILVGVA